MKDQNGNEINTQFVADIHWIGCVEGEPIIVRIIPSSWKDLYHVIMEFGDSEDAGHQILDANQIKSELGIEIEYINLPLSTIVKSNPNDFELGSKIRNLSTNIQTNAAKFKHTETN
jgi:hypothetical protein